MSTTHVYVQATGNWYEANRKLRTTAYSGDGAGLNNPAMQDIPRVGPIPVGDYTIGPAFHHPWLGPNTMHLTPAAGNNMHNRSDFDLHGDNPAMDHTASEGCIVMEPKPRQRVADSFVRALKVIATEADRP